MAENQGSPFRTCRKCNQPFSTKSAFFLHWEDCKIATTTRSKSQKPGKETPPASAPSLRCDLCNQSFQDSNGLRMHKSSSKKHKSRLPPPKSTLPQSPPIKVQGIVGLVGSSSSIPMDGTFATSGIAIPYFPPAPEPSATDNPPITTKTPSPVIQKPNVISPQMPRPPATELNHISKDQSWTMLSPLERIKLWNELQLACHTTTDLSKNGYMLAPISSEELNSRRKCQNCGCMLHIHLKVLLSQSKLIL